MSRVPNFNMGSIMISILMLILLILGLSGCGGDKEAKVQAQTPPPPAWEQERARTQTPAEDKVVFAADPLPKSQGTPEPGTVKNPLEDIHVNIDGKQFHQAGGDFSIMVGSFAQNANAVERVRILGKLGFRVVSETKVIRGKKYYRVHLRGIKSYNEAQRMGNFIKKKFGFDYLVLQR